MLKSLGAIFIVCLVAINVVSSINMDKSGTTLSSLLVTANANAEGFDECQWSIYYGACGPFLFCGYEDNNVFQECTCGSFQGGC